MSSTPNNKAESTKVFAVPLRSGVIAGKLVHLYVGAGIVSGSDSESELRETAGS